MLCAMELVGLLPLLGKAVYRGYVAGCSPEAHAHGRWRATANIFWETLPALGSYSAMRMLRFTAPSVLVADVAKRFELSVELWQKLSRHNAWLLAWEWCWLVASRMLCFVIGFDVFLIKLRLAFVYANHEHAGAYPILNIIVLFLQMLGVACAGSVGGRLCGFVFGGDRATRWEEHATRSVWKAMLARHIWTTFPIMRFLVLMLSMDDADLQRLVYSERRREDGGDLSDLERSSEGSSSEDVDQQDSSTEDQVSAGFWGILGFG
mmetsp:Transcript_16277/g.48936  ORF Transcript_16277/g.48936 Transcript_16277/m.48936 type:complete len:264 (+) Transcript_16277:1061-1852(+)